MMKKKIIIKIVLIILFVAGITGIAALYYRSFKTTEVVKEVKEKLIKIPEYQQKMRYYKINGQPVQEKFYDLYMGNEDFVGWITIEDTPIDYTVMQNGDKYLHKNYKCEYDYAGCIFADEKCDINLPSDNIILYGHHMNTNIMFTPLMKYEDQKYAVSHRFIKFDTLCENGTYEVIAAFRTQIYPEDYKRFAYYRYAGALSEEEFAEYIENIRKVSVINMGIDVSYGDKLLSLSTCAYHVSNGRFVVVAKKCDYTRIDENAILIKNINTMK